MHTLIEVRYQLESYVARTPFVWRFLSPTHEALGIFGFRPSDFFYAVRLIHPAPTCRMLKA